MSTMKNNKIKITIIAAAIIILLTVAYKLVIEPKKAVIDIVDTLYEKNGRKIEFMDLPQDQPENVVSNYYLIDITGEYKNLKYLFPSIGSIIIKNSLEAYDEGKGYKSVKVLEIDSLDEEELQKAKYNGKSFKDAKAFYTYGTKGQTYEEKAKEEGLKEYEVVRVLIETSYTEKSLESAPQYPPGLLERYFIVSRNSLGNYFIVCRSIR